MDISLTLRTNHQLLGLFFKIHEYQPNNRVEIFNRAVGVALNKQVDWNKLSKTNANYAEAITSSSTPAFIQLRVNKENFDHIVNEIKNAFNPPLIRTTTPFVVKLILINYMNYLESIQDNTELTEPDGVNSNTNINTSEIPEALKSLCEILLDENSVSFKKEILKIIESWRTKNEKNF